MSAAHKRIASSFEYTQVYSGGMMANEFMQDSELGIKYPFGEVGSGPS
jgi:hypothetical protein